MYTGTYTDFFQNSTLAEQLIAELKCYSQTTDKLLTIIILTGAHYPQRVQCFLSQPVVVKAPHLKNYRKIVIRLFVNR